MVDRVRVRTLRQHDGPDGQKWQGDEYERTKPDAEYLSGLGVVEIVTREKKSPASAKTPAGKPKSETPPQNKSEQPPTNKAEGAAGEHKG